MITLIHYTIFSLHLVVFFSNKYFYRTGVGDSERTRTPSAWLLPHYNRATLRASTDSNHDLGSDTVSEKSIKFVKLVKLMEISAT